MFHEWLKLCFMRVSKKGSTQLHPFPDLSKIPINYKSSFCHLRKDDFSCALRCNKPASFLVQACETALTRVTCSLNQPFPALKLTASPFLTRLLFAEPGHAGGAAGTLTILFFSWVLEPGARSLWAGAGVLGCDQPVGLRLLGLLDKAEGEP